MRAMRGLAIAALVAVIGAWLAVGAVASPAASHTNKILENETTHKYHYTPLSMSVKKGDTVVWSNKSDHKHTVTFDTGTYNKTVTPGNSVSRKFNQTGTFKYHCNIHSYMHGTITVSG
jgi:plastocyanin